MIRPYVVRSVKDGIRGGCICSVIGHGDREFFRYGASASASQRIVTIAEDSAAEVQ